MSNRRACAVQLLIAIPLSRTKLAAFTLAMMTTAILRFHKRLD